MTKETSKRIELFFEDMENTPREDRFPLWDVLYEISRHGRYEWRPGLADPTEVLVKYFDAFDAAEYLSGCVSRHLDSTDDEGWDWNGDLGAAVALYESQKVGQDG